MPRDGRRGRASAGARRSRWRPTARGVVATDNSNEAFGTRDARGVRTRRLAWSRPRRHRSAAREVIARRTCSSTARASVAPSGTILDCRRGRMGLLLDLHVTRRCYRMNPRLPARDGRGGRRLIRQHVLGRLVDHRGPNRFVLRGDAAGRDGLTKSVAAISSARGIRCNAICPGRSLGPRWRPAARQRGTTRPRAPPFTRAVQPNGAGIASAGENRGTSSSYLASTSVFRQPGHAHVVRRRLVEHLERGEPMKLTPTRRGRARNGPAMGRRQMASLRDLFGIVTPISAAMCFPTRRPRRLRGSVPAAFPRFAAGTRNSAPAWPAPKR